VIPDKPLPITPELSMTGLTKEASL